MKKKIFLRAFVGILAFLAVFSILVLAFDLFGLKTFIRVNTGYLYPITPKVETVEDLEKISGISFDDDAVLEKFTIERAFWPDSGWPHYVEDDLWEFDSVVTMPASDVEKLVARLEVMHYREDLETEYSDFAELEANGDKYKYIYYGDTASYSPDRPGSGEVTRGGNHYLYTAVFIKINNDETATVCIARVHHFGFGNRI